MSNAEEFGEWLRTVRGHGGMGTDVIVSEVRPVPLWQHMMVGRQMYDLFVHDPGAGGDPVLSSGRGEALLTRARSGEAFAEAESAPGDGTTRINPELRERISVLARDSSPWRREDRGAPGGRRGKPRGREDRGPQRSQPQSAGAADIRGSLPGGSASRVEVIDRLDREGLLPAITFIFSRAGCDDAVRQLLTRGTRLVPHDEGERIRRLVQERVAEVADQDLAVLGYPEFVEGLSRGFAAHHAGMLPLFREIVEHLFTHGRTRAVFATETLALGINMPARTVVLERLVKFNGEAHVPVTPAEYTQLTGRAGRRGIDIEGHAVVLHRRGVDPEEVAGLASTRTYPLRSSFRPTYNMAVNLVAQFGRERAHELLQSSFAQFQADRGVVGLATELRQAQESMAGYAEQMHCHLGDFAEYGRLRHQISEAEKAQARVRSASRRAEIAVALESLTPGQVVLVSGGRRSGMAVVLTAPKGGGRNPEPTVLTADGRLHRLTVAEFTAPPDPIGSVNVPRHFNPRNARSRRDLAATVRAQVRPGPPPRRDEPEVVEHTPAGAHDIDQLRRALRKHPCHACPDREEHARWAARWWRLRRDADDLQRRVSKRTNTVARTFDRICTLLSELGYLSQDGRSVTESGMRLRRLYNERDLVAAQCLELGTWQRLTPADFAAVVSALVHEPRGDEVSDPRMPTSEVAEAFHEMVAIWSTLTDREATHTLPLTGELDAGMAWMVHRWASGRGLEEVLRDSDLTAGDFVRRCKQVVDLLGQISTAGSGPVAETARRAADAVLRGVVAADRLD